MNTITCCGIFCSISFLQMNINRKKLFRWLKIILLFYCTIGIALFYLQEIFLFHPVKLSADYKFNFPGKYEEMMIPLNETDTMSLVKFYPVDSLRKGIVIYFHGNRENINRYAPFVTPFTKLGYEVWMEDYPGFGKSAGVITEKKLYDQALQIQKLAALKYSSDSIIIYGKSLGTGIAAYTAANSEAKMLILESPYYSIPALFDCYAFIYPNKQMSTYKIPVYNFLEDVNYPVVIFHGTDDWVVPYRCSSKLKTVLKPADKYITIYKADHHNINQTRVYYKAIDSLLRK
jgi:uncharacterized protein